MKGVNFGNKRFWLTLDTVAKPLGRASLKRSLCMKTSSNSVR